MSTESRAYERRWWTLGVLSLSVLVIAFAGTILNVAIPTLARELHASARDLRDAAHRLPGDHRHRRGRAHAGDAVDPGGGVPGTGARPGDRDLGGHDRPRPPARADPGRMAARALRLGLGLPGQRAAGGS